MKNKIILLMLLSQLVLMANITAQSVGITTATPANGFPASTLDVQGSLGVNLVTNPTSALTTGAVVLYNNSTSVTPVSLALPLITTGNTYLNRIYILANATALPWAILQSTTLNATTFFYNLINNKTVSVPANSSVIIISDGTNWLQIK